MSRLCQVSKSSQLHRHTITSGSRANFLRISVVSIALNFAARNRKVEMKTNRRTIRAPTARFHHASAMALVEQELVTAKGNFAFEVSFEVSLRVGKVEAMEEQWRKKCDKLATTQARGIQRRQHQIELHLDLMAWH